MARSRRSQRESDYQDPRDPVRLIAQAAQPKLRRDVKAALLDLRKRVPVAAIARHIRNGQLSQARDAVPLDHFREVLKQPFQRLGEIWNDAADVGAGRINADFKRAGKRVRYRPRVRKAIRPDKSTHTEANYRPGRVPHVCGMCWMFQAPASCVAVDDPIELLGVCDYFEPLDNTRKDYNPDEPRDERGRWTAGGGGDFPEAGPKVDGLTVLDDVPNIGSISASLDDYTELSGIREVPFAEFGAAGPPKFYSVEEEARTHRLAREIAASGEIKPLIVVVEENNAAAGPYILEGGHRFDALKLLGKKSFPAVVVVDHQEFSKRLRKAVGDGFDFDLLDEDTQDELRALQDALIAELDEKARDTIEGIISGGIAAGDTADEMAANIRDTITLTERQAQAVTNYRNLLEDLNRGALDRALRNTDYDAIVQTAINRGEFLTDAEIDRLVEDYADNYLDYRADTIARTESLRAANAGLRDSYRQAADRGVFPAEAVTRRWRIATDERVCPICQSIAANNKGGVGLDEDFESADGPVDDPPVHPSCRCTVEYVTNLDMLPADEVEQEVVT